MSSTAEDWCAFWHKPFAFLFFISVKKFFYLNGLLNILQEKNRMILRQYFGWLMKCTWPVRILSTVKTIVQRKAAAVRVGAFAFPGGSG